MEIFGQFFTPTSGHVEANNEEMFFFVFSWEMRETLSDFVASGKCQKTVETEQPPFPGLEVPLNSKSSSNPKIKTTSYFRSRTSFNYFNLFFNQGDKLYFSPTLCTTNRRSIWKMFISLPPLTGQRPR